MNSSFFLAVSSKHIGPRVQAELWIADTGERKNCMGMHHQDVNITIAAQRIGDTKSNDAHRFAQSLCFLLCQA